jgi:hypothetical protein
MSKLTLSLLSTALCLSTMLAPVAATPVAAQGLGGLLKKKLKQRIEHVKEQAVDQAALMAAEAIMCAMGDQVCISEAKANGKPVILVDESVKQAQPQLRQGEPAPAPAGGAIQCTETDTECISSGTRAEPVVLEKADRLPSTSGTPPPAGDDRRPPDGARTHTGAALSTTGDTFKVIGRGAARKQTDTSVVIVVPPPSDLVRLAVTPDPIAVNAGATRSFTATGYLGDGSTSPVEVSWTATGGEVDPAGVYLAGAAAGSYLVVATNAAGTLADTAVVTINPPAPPPAPPAPPEVRASDDRAAGLPFGPAGGYTYYNDIGMAPFTGSMDPTSPSRIVSQLANARSAKRRVLLAMTGGSHDQYLTNGVFDMGKWRAKMDTYNTSPIKQAIAAAVADGTIIGNSVMDEPNVSGAGDGNTWGPKGTMTKARVDELCGYVKALFPTLQVGVAHRHDIFEPTKSYRVCDFIASQYSWRAGDVMAFRDAGLALAKRDGHAILFSMNILNGGIQAARDGLWNCSLTNTGGRGTYEPNCRMTAQQVHDWGLILGPAGCGLNLWRYDADFMSRPANVQAFKDVAARLAALPGKACRRS